MRRHRISLFELALLESQGFVNIYCMLNPSTVPNIPAKLPQYYDNFQKLLQKYSRIPSESLLDYIGCEYVSEVEIHSNDDIGSIT